MMVTLPTFNSHHPVTLVDCHWLNAANESQIIGVIDHHHVEKLFPEYVALSHESSWSTTLQIYTKILGSGFDVDSETARILAEATMLEAKLQLVT
jgi:inorganic pyrophosphatase/exopolyphosphatase